MAYILLTRKGGQVFSGIGGGLNELIALAGAAELVPIAKRGNYVSAIVFTIIPFCPSALYAQLIAEASNWRYIGILVGVWNFLGLIFVVTLYKDPPRRAGRESKSERLHRIDYVGGVLSISGILLFMMGLQWGAVQVRSDPGIQSLLTSASTLGVVSTSSSHSSWAFSWLPHFSYGRCDLRSIPWPRTSFSVSRSELS